MQYSIYRLTAQELTTLEAFTEQCRHRSIPESFAKAIVAYLAHDGSLANVHDEYQSIMRTGVPWLMSWLGVALTVIYRQNAGVATLTSFGERALDVAIATDSVAAYLACAADDGPIEQIVAYLRSHDIEEQQILQWLIQVTPYVRQQRVDAWQDRPIIRSSGRFLLTYLPDRFIELRNAIQKTSLLNSAHPNFWQFFVELLASADRAYLDLAATLAEQLPPENRLYCLPALLRAEPVRFSPWMRQAILDPTVMAHRKHSLLDALVQIAPAEQRELLESFVRDSTTIIPQPIWAVSTIQGRALEALHKLDAQTTLPLIESCLDSADASLATLAIRLLVAGSADLNEAQAARLQQIIAERPTVIALAAAKELLNHQWPGRQSFACALLTHRYAKLRDEAIAWWQEQGQDLFALLTPLLDHGSAEVRLTALLALHQADSQRALPLLIAHYAREKSLKVRQALDPILPAESAPATSDTIADAATRIATLSAEAAQLAGKRWQTPPWLDWTALAQLRWTTGEPIPNEVIRGLLYRQAQLKKMLLDSQVRQAAALIDRTNAAPVAQSLFSAWMMNGAQARYSWLLPLIGALANDDLVPLVHERIKKLRKSAQSAQIASRLAQMLAQIGTPLALTEVRELAQHAKQGTVRHSARLAFAEATRTLNISLDELEDEIVPRLGFDVSGTQPFAFSSHPLTIRLGACLDLQLWNASGELLLALPRARAGDDKAAIAAAKQRWQMLKKQVQQLATIQSARLDQACSRRRSWTIARWRQLFLDHPVLHSLAMAYVWEATDATSGDRLFFRVAADSALLDIEDTPVTLPEEGSVSLAHPLTMAPQLRESWLERLAEDELAPRISQLDRPMLALEESERGNRWWTREQGHIILQSDLMSIAQRTGWEPPNPDFYRNDLLYKSFPAAGIEALLYTGVIWQGASRFGAATTPIVRLGFVPAGTIAQTVATAENAYLLLDKAPIEARTLTLGEVPPLLFSEAASDVAAMGAKGAFDPQWQSHIS